MRQPAASQRGTLTEPAKTSTPSTRDRAVRAPALGEPPALHVSACEVLEFVPDAVVGVDGNGCIAFVNIQAENMFGYERREMLGKRVELLLPDHLKELHVQRRTSYHANPIARPMKARRDLVARRKDGSEFPVEISLGKLRAFGGVQVISAIRDVTERARLEQERERLLSVADRSRAEAQRTAEAVGRLQALTDAALTHLSLDALLRELLHRIRTLLAVDEATVLFLEEDEQMLRVAATDGLDETRARTVRIPIGDGFAGRVAAGREALIIEDLEQADLLNPLLGEAGIRSLLGVPLVIEGRLLGVFHVGSTQVRRFVDDDLLLTRMVAERVALAADRGRLLCEVEQRAHAQAEEQGRVRTEAERMRDDLTNMLVHDLKNPVNGIAMSAQLLLRKGDLSDAQQRHLVQIARTCRELNRLVQDIVEIAKIEADRMPIATEPIVLAELLDEVAIEYGPLAQEMGRRFTVAAGTALPPAVADRVLLKRVLVNLIVNALRHSGSAQVSVEAAVEHASAGITIRVVDHGHGIAEEDQIGVFEKFKTTRGDPTADTGLGLPFCKLAVERMSGHITLHSTPGVGTVFAVTLPCEDQPA